MSGYIGTQPVPQATQTRDSFTATSGQTSFATGGYTPNFLDVYLNGVKLAAADYTASNGSDVVLASGAATGDILEVVAFTTFTPANIPDGTPSIDDNGNATAITIDSSENVGIGTSSPSNALHVHQSDATSNSYVHITQADGGSAGTDGLSIGIEASGVNAVIRNRENGYLRMYTNNAERMRITSSGNVGIGTATPSGKLELYGSGISDLPLVINHAWGSSSTALISASAASSEVFKVERNGDLTLSGGVYLGGTAAANKLDDYEEGTFTPTLITGTVSTSYGFYTKIGNTVIARMEYGNFSDTTSNSNIEVNNLPFTSSSVSSSGAAGSVFIRYSNRIPNATYVGNNGTRTVMWESSSGSYTTLKHADLNSSTAFIYAQVIYEAT